jgi:hypothetical protein
MDGIERVKPAAARPHGAIISGKGVFLKSDMGRLGDDFVERLPGGIMSGGANHDFPRIHMTRIIVDSDLLARLHGLSERLEFCDPSGNTLGVFQPATPKAAPREGVDGSPFTREQLKRRCGQRTGRPLTDILRDLEQS